MRELYTIREVAGLMKLDMVREQESIFTNAAD